MSISDDPLMPDISEIRWSDRTEWLIIPKQDRSREKMLRILDQAAFLFSRDGFEQTTIAEIAKAAKVSATSIYRRFPDKNAILYTILDSWSRVRTKDYDTIWQKAERLRRNEDELIRFYVDIHFSAYRNDTGFLALLEKKALDDDIISNILCRMKKHAATRLLECLIQNRGLNASKALEEKVWHMQSIVTGTIVLLMLSASGRNWPPYTIQSDALKQSATKAAIACLKKAPGPADS